MSDDPSAQIHLHGSTFSVVLHAPVVHLPAYQTLLETAVCAFASARDPTSATRDLESLQLASNELGTQVSHLHIRAGEETLTSVLYSWLWSCLRAERRYSEVYRSELNSYRTRSREGWPREVQSGLAKTIRLRRDDVRALKDVATFAVEVLRILRSSTPPPSYTDATSDSQTQPPSYSRWCHPRSVQQREYSPTTATATAAPPPSRPLRPTSTRAMNSRSSPFSHSMSSLQKRLLRPRLPGSRFSSTLSPMSTMQTSPMHTQPTTTRQEEQAQLIRRRRRMDHTSSSTSTSSPRQVPRHPEFPLPTSLLQVPPSLLINQTTSYSQGLLPLSSSSSSISPSQSTHHHHSLGLGFDRGLTIDNDDLCPGKTDAQLAFESWLDAPRCPNVIPPWHFQPAEGEADWLTEMLM